MVLVAQLPTISAFAWAPWPGARSLLVTGSASGAMDENFNNDAQLEIWAVENGNAERRISVTASARFNRIAWSMPSDSHNKGLIATGAESGEVGIWDAAILIAGDSSKNALIHTSTSHKGPVRGLEFSPVDTTLLASGGPNGEIFVYDTKDPSFTPRAPGPISGKLSDISCLSWNRRLAYILAASSNNGQTVVWDLRNKREASCLSYSGQEGTIAGPASSGRRSVSSVLWHPENATRLATASDDDSCPVIMLWDLRNAHAPEKILIGHNKGILDLAWCVQDSDMLLSCGKDNRTLCWNPSSGEILAEAQQNSNWTFQVDWSIQNPNIFANASFDGTLTIQTLQSTGGDQHKILTQTFTNDGADLFDGPIRSTESSSSALLSLSQAPRWLRRPVCANFGFGGRLVTVNNTAQKTDIKSGLSHVQVQTIADEPIFQKRAETLHNAIQAKTLAAFAEDALKADQTEDWKALQTLFLKNSREELITLLGFNKSDIHAQIANYLSRSKPKSDGDAPAADLEQNVTGSLKSNSAGDLEEPLPAIDVEMISKQAENTPIPFSPASAVPDDDFFNQITPQLPSKGVIPAHITIPHIQQSSAISVAATAGSRAPSPSTERHVDVSFQIYPSHESEADRILTRALIVGDFDSAVSLCLEINRFADALVIASKAGPGLFQKAQTAYFAKNMLEAPFLRLCQAITAEDLTDIVHNANLADWKDIFAIICTFSKGQEFSFLTEQLGQRLQLSFRLAEDTQTTVESAEIKQDRANAVVCYLAAQNLEQLVAIWTEQMQMEVSTCSGDGMFPDLTGRALALQSLIEKVTVFRLATDYVDQDLAKAPANKDYKLSRLYDLYTEYAELLASQGRLDIASEVVKRIPERYVDENLTEAQFGVIRNRLSLRSSAGDNVMSAANVVTGRESVNHNSNKNPSPGNYQQKSVQTQIQPIQSQQEYFANTNRYNQNPDFRTAASQMTAGPKPLAQTQGFASNYAVQQQALPVPTTFQSPAIPGITPSPQTLPPKKAAGGWNDIPISRKATPVSSLTRASSNIVSSPFPQSENSPRFDNPNTMIDTSSGQSGFQAAPPVMRSSRIMSPPPGSTSRHYSQSDFSAAIGRQNLQDGSKVDQALINSMQDVGMMSPPIQGFAVPTSAQDNNIYSHHAGVDPSAPSFNNQLPIKAVSGPKYPPGDRTHIDPGSLPIFEVLSAELMRYQQTCTTAQKRQADDCVKRLNGLFDAMNCDLLEASIIDLLHGVARALSLHDPIQAASAHVNLITTYNGKLPEFLGWAQGIKPLISRQAAEMRNQ